jgi:hypothetical protein
VVPPPLFANRGGGTSCVLPFSGFLMIFNVYLPTNYTASYHPTKVEVGGELTTGLNQELSTLYCRCLVCQPDGTSNITFSDDVTLTQVNPCFATTMTSPRPSRL